MLEGLGFREKSLLLGDICELGAQSERIHRKIGRAAFEHGLCRIYLFGRDAALAGQAAEESGFPPECVFYNPSLECPEITANQIKNNEGADSVVLFKASRAVGLERVIDCLRRS